jgi:DNA (cytosine-5)-methyltransferase 1
MICTAKPEIRFCDLFAGLGGFHLAATRLGCQCVFASEINPALRDLYKQNFGLAAEGDIRLVDLDRIPPHELLCAGFPCQPFSKAGAQRGLEDSVRGTLFANILEIVRLRRPQFILLENVAHFVNHDDGNTYLRAKDALQALGYEIKSKELSPHQFGVPQIRQRMYMVGQRKTLGDFRWPEPTHCADALSIRNVLDPNPVDAIAISERDRDCLKIWQQFLNIFPKAAKLPSFPVWSMEFGANYPVGRKNLRHLSLAEIRKYRGSHGRRLKGAGWREVEALLPSHARGNGEVFPYWKKRFIQQNRALYAEYRKEIDQWMPKILSFPPSLQKLEWHCQGETRDIWEYVIQFRASGVRVKRATTAPSLVAMTATQVPIIAWERRYMTPRECARLQSMGDLKILPTGEAAVEAFGNAVNVSVVESILGQLLKSSAIQPVNVAASQGLPRVVAAEFRSAAS